jgi:5'-nucleotidase
MRLLLVNDDGIYSPGLLALARAARRFGEVRIVAPDVEQSSMGQAITYTRPLTIKQTPIGDFNAWRVNGTPSDCAALGLNAWSHVDAVLSGINLGVNLGNSAWHSGTLAAARQAVLLGCRGIALSTVTGDSEPDFAGLEPYVGRVLELLFAADAPRLVNVNFPREPEGVHWTRLSVRRYDGRVVPGRDPHGREHFWLVVHPIEEVEPDTDRWAIRHGLVSLTPLALDITDETALERMNGAVSASA